VITTRFLGSVSRRGAGVEEAGARTETRDGRRACADDNDAAATAAPGWTRFCMAAPCGKVRCWTEVLGLGTALFGQQTGRSTWPPDGEILYPARCGTDCAPHAWEGDLGLAHLTVYSFFPYSDGTISSLNETASAMPQRPAGSCGREEAGESGARQRPSSKI
jgi:hypothetical protein